MFNGFLDKLRALGEEKKKILLIVIVAIVMIAVIYLWLGYFNNLVVGFNESQIASPERAEGFSFWQTMRAGVAAIYDNFSGIFGSPKEYMINPSAPANN